MRNNEHKMGSTHEFKQSGRTPQLKLLGHGHENPCHEILRLSGRKSCQSVAAIVLYRICG